jgi:two-component system sensor histidine kinase BaeS
VTDTPLLGRLGRRLLVAFILVALASVAVLTAAALIGTARGLDASEVQQRQAAADAAAAAAAEAYRSAGGWAGADLTDATAIARSAGAELSVRDAGNGMLAGGPGMGTGMGAGSGRGITFSEVVVDGVNVGSVRLGFGSPPGSTAQTIAWTWILIAAVVALAVAVGAAVTSAHWLTSPLVRLADTAQRFGRGERSARPALQDIASTTEIGDVAQAFAAAADDVERSETARRRLSADVAHELRTPLAVLQAGLEELRDGYVDPDTDRLAALHDQSLRLGRIVEDLSLLAAAETASLTLHRQRVDLGELLEEAVTAARPTLDAAGMSVTSQVLAGVFVDGDPDRLHQLIGNLLVNAARHCHRGAHVDVRLSTATGVAIVTVEDDGPGIPADDLDRVFDRLQRGSTATGSGSGIGLAVVKELVVAHGGTVRAESDGRTGTAIVITLPMSGGG